MSTTVTRTAALAAVTRLAAAGAPARAEPHHDAPDLSDVGGGVDKAVAEQPEDGDVPGAAVSIVDNPPIRVRCGKMVDKEAAER